MGKAMYTEVNGVARKVKQPYAEGGLKTHTTLSSADFQVGAYTFANGTYSSGLTNYVCTKDFIDVTIYSTVTVTVKGITLRSDSGFLLYDSDKKYIGSAGSISGETMMCHTANASYIKLDIARDGITVSNITTVDIDIAMQSLVTRKVKNGWVEVANVARRFFGDSRYMLYDTGDECVSMTGGWGNYCNATSGWWGGCCYAGVRNSDHVLLKNTASTRQAVSVATANKISTVGFTKLCIDVEVQSLTGDAIFVFGVADNLSNAGTWVTNLGYNAGGISSERQTLYIDNIPQGDYYVVPYCSRNSGSFTVKVYKIWCE